MTIEEQLNEDVIAFSRLINSRRLEVEDKPRAQIQVETIVLTGQAAKEFDIKNINQISSNSNAQPAQ